MLTKLIIILIKELNTIYMYLLGNIFNNGGYK